MKRASILIVLFGNLWIWRIFSFSAPLAILVVLCTFSFYLLIGKRNPKKSLKIFLLLFIPLLFFQWKTTDKISLTKLSNDQQRIQSMRLREYPPVKVDLLGKTVWIPIAHWFEGRTESISFFRILSNFSEVVDPNLYFFANHPRERVGVQEFEKFPFLLLPFFVYGLLQFVQKTKNQKLLIISFFAPVLLTSFIGSKNSFGPFSLFPFVTVFSALGLFQVSKNTFKKYKTNKKQISLGFLLIYILVLIQQYSYGIN